MVHPLTLDLRDSTLKRQPCWLTWLLLQHKHAPAAIISQKCVRTNHLGTRFLYRPKWSFFLSINFIWQFCTGLSKWSTDLYHSLWRHQLWIQWYYAQMKTTKITGNWILGTDVPNFPILAWHFLLLLFRSTASIFFFCVHNCPNLNSSTPY